MDAHDELARIDAQLEALRAEHEHACAERRAAIVEEMGRLSQRKAELVPAAPFGSVPRVEIRQGGRELVRVLPDGTEHPLRHDEDGTLVEILPDGTERRPDEAHRRGIESLERHAVARAIGESDRPLTLPEIAREAGVPVARVRRYVRAVFVPPANERARYIPPARRPTARPRSRGRRAQAGARGQCRAGPSDSDDPDGGEPDLDQLPALYSVGEHHRLYADRTPTKRLALFLELPAWQRAQAYEVLLRAADLEHDEAAS